LKSATEGSTSVALTRITINKVAKRFGYERAVANVSLELRQASACALLGHNGAGKTTLLAMLSTLVEPTSGTIHYFRNSVEAARDNELRRDIGLLSHSSLCYGDLSAIENLELFAKLYGVTDHRSNIDAMLDAVGLDPKARTRIAKTYSRGMMQRLALARALLPTPTLVLLDEPFTGLDRGGAMALGATIGKLKQRGAIVVIVTHDLEAISGIADHVAVLRRGALVHESRVADASSGFSYVELKDAYHQYGERELGTKAAS
jgi:heme exporter protein A